MRPEDGNARQVQQTFAGGATLGKLEKHISFLRSPGALGDAHPMIMAWLTRTGGSHAL